MVLVTRPDFVLPRTRETSASTAGAAAAFLGLLALAFGLGAAAGFLVVVALVALVAVALVVFLAAGAFLVAGVFLVAAFYYESVRSPNVGGGILTVAVAFLGSAFFAAGAFFSAVFFSALGSTFSVFAAAVLVSFLTSFTVPEAPRLEH